MMLIAVFPIQRAYTVDGVGGTAFVSGFGTFTSATTTLEECGQIVLPGDVCVSPVTQWRLKLNTLILSGSSLAGQFPKSSYLEVVSAPSIM